MEEHLLLPVSPRHTVRLASEYQVLVEKPAARDFVVRTVAQRAANGLPLVTAEIVIAGRETREAHPLAATYPLHFKKTYFAARMHGDTKHEFDGSQRASELAGFPPPIGHEPRVFRSCLVPGSPFDRVSPFGVEPEDRNIHVAETLPLASAVGVFRLLEEAWSHLLLLQGEGLCHGDTELKNFIVCPTPLEMVIIDFESAVFRESVTTEAWTERVALDHAPLLREAVFLQCALGRQPTEMATRAWDLAPTLFRDGERFRRAIERQSDLGS